MKRNVSMEEISDGRLYSRTDMVRVGCGGCRGCSACCSGMGSSVVLDPLDLFRLTVSLGSSFEELMTDKIELNVVDGIILPNLKMSSHTETCAFLNEQGRCSIHPHRPGICRLFPLGRFYGETSENGETAVTSNGERSFRYFLQVHECPAPNKTKVKIEKWLDVPDLPRYERFICDWHYFLEELEARISRTADDTDIKNINLFVLKLFYMRPYTGDRSFYEQFYERMKFAEETLA